MAKITFTKLGLKVSDEIKTLNYEGSQIEVKQYLPQNEKIDFITFVLENSIDEKTNTFSPIRITTYFNIAIIKWYTNITFTDKQLEDVLKTYDKLESSGFLFKVKQLIPQDEYSYMDDIVYDTIHDYETFANSFVGMISTINSDAKNLGNQVDEILSKIRNKEGLEELAAIKDIVG